MPLLANILLLLTKLAVVAVTPLLPVTALFIVNVPWLPLAKLIVLPVDDIAPLAVTLPWVAPIPASLFATVMLPGDVIAPNAILPDVLVKLNELPIKLLAPPPITVPAIDVGVAVTEFVPPLNETLPPAFIAMPLTFICDALL